MYFCIIVDDQKDSVNLLKDHVSKISALSVKLATTNPIEALNFFDNETVDIVFLDIEMPEITGLDFIESLKEKLGHTMPKIVFATSYNQYALKGYDYGVADYLMKPISFKRFQIAVDRIIKNLNKIKEKDKSHDFFFADYDGKKIKIDFNDILYVEGAGNYIIIGTGTKKLAIIKTMVGMAEILPPDKFLRVHKSYIVAIEKIKAIRGNTILIEEKNNTKTIPVGASYRQNLVDCLGL